MYIPLDGIGRFFKVLSEAQILQFNAAALDHIARHGFVVHHAGLLERARARGAGVDAVGGRVRIPHELSLELLTAAPSRYKIANILGETWEVGGEHQLGTAIVTDPWVIDYPSGNPRRPCLEDMRRHTIVAEQLEPVAEISRMEFPVTDVAGPSSCLRALEMHLLHHTRHYMVMATGLESFDQWMGIVDILARGGEVSRLITAAIATASPLALNEINAELLLRALDKGFAVTPTVCPMAGSTAPYSLAGALLQSHIEALMFVLLVQILKPGHPVKYACGLSVADLRDASDLYYTLDKVLWSPASVQLAKSLNLPVFVECGGTLTNRHDVQCGAEGMLFMLGAHASGADVLSGFGSCNNAMAMSAEMMVIQQAHLRAARHIARGIRTDGGRMGLESLERVGPGGHFLDDELTVDLLHSDEFFRDDIFDMSGRPGGRSMLERAHARVEQMIDGFVSRVPEVIQEALRRHVHDLTARLG